VHSAERVGYESKGPLMVTTEPNGSTDVLSDVCCWSWSARRHHFCADSAATLPPWANPKRWMRCAGHPQSPRRWSNTVIM